MSGALCLNDLLRLSSRAVIYKSHSANVFQNLLIEDYILRNSPIDQMCLMLYSNYDCVVLGRNQALFAEVSTNDLSFLIARRYSGGGAVFHDLGNVNYSIIMPRSIFDRTWAAQMICDSLSPMNKSLTVNDRNDIYVNGKKCSGSAYRISRERAYHHGTFLLNSNLNKLKSSLKSPVQLTSALSVTSVSASVTNFSDSEGKKVHSADFVSLVCKEFKRKFENAEIVDIYGSTPISGDQVSTVEWVVKKGPPYSFKYGSKEYSFAQGLLMCGDTEVDIFSLFPELKKQFYTKNLLSAVDHCIF